MKRREWPYALTGGMGAIVAGAALLLLALTIGVLGLFLAGSYCSWLLEVLVK